MSTVPFIFAGNTGNIPLSQLDADFANVKLSVDFVIQNAQANINSVGTLTALSVSGNILVGGIASVAGNVTVGNNANLVGNITAGNIATAGRITATGNITGGNILTLGLYSSAGNVTAGNILTPGSVSALANVTCNILIANTVSASTLDAADVGLTGNLIVAGNAQVNGTTTFINTQNLNITDKNITIANNATTSSQIDGAGIDAGNPPVAYIRYSNASQGWTTASTFSITGAAFAATPANTTANTQVATTAFVRNIIPTGVITLWYGNIASIPSGWFLCDGGNSTPDLRDRFIVGAGSTYAVANVGGSANAVVVDHTHTANSVVTDPGHNHSYTAPAGAPNNAAGAIPDQITQQTLNTANAFTGVTVATSIANAGVSGSNANLPPYYALAYIMKA